ncbi:MAG: PilN domain-containing protein [Gemmatimonadaceae bacterium]|nr:PilN domain-containing protein [Gemmatimonadota bacterium]MBK7834865.1 PilN domain-containing protein [Gemmatimonadota bacterium]MBK8061279.1 PilN domain-containing protein [Gemmatimonadota bacterium]MBK8647288.1 PilN domain-containing protein [Gemmatimonadota bacterium]MCC7322394.1 PilN domain-containing protein [Gemmatimonadaceae bacterium]
MIEINLLPGADKHKGRGSGFSLKAAAAGVSARIRDPYLLSAVASVLIAAAGIGGMHLSQSSTLSTLEEREQGAVRDSARFAVVLKERRKAEAKRDSVVRQLEIIRSIDNDRFVWPHILDEVSRALPPYTWLKSIAQTAAVAPPAAAAPKDAKDGKPAAEGAANTKQDPQPSTEPLRFRVIGNTVDIQALTRFMKVLETSPFVQNVQLARSELVMVDGKEVTEFQLDAEYERPEKGTLTTAPVSLSVR